MKNLVPFAKSNLRNRVSAITASVVALVMVLTGGILQADIPDRQYTQLNGMYQVVSSNDPLFPVSSGTEWFMDFGKGIHENTFSGSVAVSRRQNPDVKVRILAWQFFPNQSNLVIGAQFDRGSSNAVAKGSWSVESSTEGLIFRRAHYQMIVQRANPRDY